MGAFADHAYARALVHRVALFTYKITRNDTILHKHFKLQTK